MVPHVTPHDLSRLHMDRSYTSLSPTGWIVNRRPHKRHHPMEKETKQNKQKQKRGRNHIKTPTLELSWSGTHILCKETQWDLRDARSCWLLLPSGFIGSLSAGPTATARVARLPLSPYLTLSSQCPSHVCPSILHQRSTHAIIASATGHPFKQQRRNFPVLCSWSWHAILGKWHRRWRSLHGTKTVMGFIIVRGAIHNITWRTYHW